MMKAHPRTTGFTLAEVLISLGIFAIGMIAVASLFPVAAILQKETADDILGQQSANNARATIEAIGLTYFDPDTAFADDLDNYHQASSDRYGATTLQFSGVVPIADLLPPAQPSGTSFYARFSLGERSFPSTEADWDERDHYWFFYVRDTAGSPTSPNWQGYVLIVEREEDQAFVDVDSELMFGDPTGNIDQGTPYITVDGKTGTWDVNTPPTALLGGGVFWHPEGIAIETFTFETLTP